MNTKKLIILLILVVLVIIGYKFINSKSSVSPQNQADQNEEAISSEEGTEVAEGQQNNISLGVIDSKYITDQEFIAYIEKTLKDLLSIEQKNIYEESIAVVDKTRETVRLLAENKPEEAVKTIEQAMGKLDKVLTLEPEAKTLPISAEAEITTLKADKATLETLKKQIEEAVQAGDFQLARALLNDLRSEVVLRTVEIPLVAHGAAMRSALVLINEGKIAEAQDVLQKALNTLVTINRIIPIPLLNAELLVQESSAIVEQDKAKALGMLEEARQQIETAKLLGYGFTYAADYAAIETAIDILEKTIKEEKDSSDNYDSLSKDVKNLREKISE